MPSEQFCCFIFFRIMKVLLFFQFNISESSQTVSIITVIREERMIDTIFTISVAILVSILYINFGCAMDWTVCRETLRRPIGPAIGFFCQFLIMPLVNLLIVNRLDVEAVDTSI